MREGGATTPSSFISSARARMVEHNKFLAQNNDKFQVNEFGFVTKAPNTKDAFGAPISDIKNTLELYVSNGWDARKTTDYFHLSQVDLSSSSRNSENATGNYCASDPLTGDSRKYFGVSPKSLDLYC